MIRTIFAVVLVIALAMTASAFDIRTYDALYTGDTAATPEAGIFGIQGSFVYMMADKSYDQDGDSHEWGDDNKATGMWFPIKFSYGVMDNFELGVTPTFVMNKLEMTGEEYEGTGLADTWIWAKYGFMPDPMVTARLGFKVATGTDVEDADLDELPTSSGQMDIDAGLLFGLPSGPGSLDGSIGYRFRMAKTFEDDTEMTPGSEVNFTAGYTYFLGDAMNLRLGASGFFGGDWEDDGETVEESGQKLVSINPGFDYIMDSGVSLGFDVYYPLMGANIDAGWGMGLSVGWGSY